MGLFGIYGLGAKKKPTIPMAPTEKQKAKAAAKAEKALAKAAKAGKVQVFTPAGQVAYVVDVKTGAQVPVSATVASASSAYAAKTQKAAQKVQAKQAKADIKAAAKQAKIDAKTMGVDYTTVPSNGDFQTIPSTDAESWLSTWGTPAAGAAIPSGLTAKQAAKLQKAQAKAAAKLLKAQQKAALKAAKAGILPGTSDQVFTDTTTGQSYTIDPITGAHVPVAAPATPAEQQPYDQAGYQQQYGQQYPQQYGGGQAFDQAGYQTITSPDDQGFASDYGVPAAGGVDYEGFLQQPPGQGAQGDVLAQQERYQTQQLPSQSDQPDQGPSETAFIEQPTQQVEVSMAPSMEDTQDLTLTSEDVMAPVQLDDYRQMAARRESQRMPRGEAVLAEDIEALDLGQGFEEMADVQMVPSTSDVKAIPPVVPEGQQLLISDQIDQSQLDMGADLAIYENEFGEKELPQYQEIRVKGMEGISVEIPIPGTPGTVALSEKEANQAQKREVRAQYQRTMLPPNWSATRYGRVGIPVKGLGGLRDFYSDMALLEVLHAEGSVSDAEYAQQKEQLVGSQDRSVVSAALSQDPNLLAASAAAAAAHEAGHVAAPTAAPSAAPAATSHAALWIGGTFLGYLAYVALKK